MTRLKKVIAGLLVLILLINAAVIIVAFLLRPKHRIHKLTVDNSILTDLERIGVQTGVLNVDDLVPVNEPLDSAFSQKVFISTIGLSGIEILMSLLVLLILLKAKEGWRLIWMILLAICIVLSIVTTVLFVTQSVKQRRLEDPIDKNLNNSEFFIKLKSNMSASLTKNYTSDSTDTDNNVSDSWNLRFFIGRNCCAVNPINSTTNDFDTTPWCTTSGDCQMTNSQIPKTCCASYNAKNPSETNSRCYEYVESGFYKMGCFNVVKRELQFHKDDYIQRQKEQQKNQNKYFKDVTIYWKILSYIKGASCLCSISCFILSVILFKKCQNKDTKTEMKTMK
ncbi:uncharacterized protein LOC134234650 [Saccostrea cucullata]|uniref:uncharacterized protein LOC134234650 n=1 Tax=Saccostrea cuccullata TaxID=36930 RepID=UPI002ED4B6BF